MVSRRSRFRARAYYFSFDWIEQYFGLSPSNAAPSYSSCLALGLLCWFRSRPSRLHTTGQRGFRGSSRGRRSRTDQPSPQRRCPKAGTFWIVTAGQQTAISQPCLSLFYRPACLGLRRFIRSVWQCHFWWMPVAATPSSPGTRAARCGGAPQPLTASVVMMQADTVASLIAQIQFNGLNPSGGGTNERRFANFPQWTAADR